MSRNELCACGSGKRYKHCHGLLGAPDAKAAPDAGLVPELPRRPAAGPSALHREALVAHRAGLLGRAEALYREALVQDPDDVASLHLLGAVLHDRLRYQESLEALAAAAERTGWKQGIVLDDLAQVLAMMMSSRVIAQQQALIAGYLASERARKSAPAVAAHVTVVLPVYNQAALVARAIRSVAAQTYGDIDLVVVDDGSTDGSAEVVADCLASLPLRSQLLRVAHGGAATAANRGAAAAMGPYLAFLNAADEYAPERIARMVAGIARTEATWGFTRVQDGADKPASARAAPLTRADAFVKAPDFAPGSFTLLTRDAAGASGNLFMRRDLFDALGGYRDVPGYRGWDLCVRAALQVEPVVLDDPLYRRGPRSRNAIGAAARSIPPALVAAALAPSHAVNNPWCPQYPGNRDVFVRAELQAGHRDRIPLAVLQALVAEFRGHAVATAPAAQPLAAVDETERVALVVLGVYRSGTSAVARVLNLCGAALAENVHPPRLGLNPTGFWETEAVTELNKRVLKHMGGNWHRVDFVLPSEGPLVDEFAVDAQALLAREHGDAPFILIKDPRICVLAPLWHRALLASGYRPVYVVPVRNPLEVARSIWKGGGVPVAEGIELWQSYMQSVESFVAGTDAAVVHMRYDELLDDWRAVVQRIAQRLRVPLDTNARGEEVDDFLDTSMHNQRATDAELDAQLAGTPGVQLRALYARLLARCAADAEPPQRD